MHAARALTMFMCIGFFFLVATTVGADPRPPFRMLVRSVEFSDDGKLLVVVITRRWNSFTDSTMGLIDVSKGKWAPVKFDMGFPGKVLTATFTPDGTAAVSGCEDSTIRFSDIGTGKKIRMLKTDSKGVNCLSFSGDGKLLLSGETGGLVLWDVEKEKPIRRLTGKRITSAVLSKNGKLALSDDEEEYATIVWDTEAGKPVQKLTAIKGERKDKRSYYSTQIALSTDECFALQRETGVAVWDLRTGQQIKAINPCGTNESVAFTRSGRFVLTARMSEPARLWEVSTGNEVLAFKKKLGANPVVAVSPNGRQAVSGDDTNITLWDLNNGSVIWTIP